MKRFKRMLSHLCLIFSLLFVTLFNVHLFNPRMQMLTGDVMHVYLLLFCAASSALSLLVLYGSKRQTQSKQQNEKQPYRQSRRSAGKPQGSDRRG